MSDHTNRVIDLQPALTTIEATVLINILEGNRHGFTCFPAQLVNLQKHGLLDKKLMVTRRGELIARLHEAQARAKCAGRTLGEPQCA